MIAIMRTGAAYVPLDPQAPEERIKWIIQDINSPIILTEQSITPLLNHIAPSLTCLNTDNLNEWNIEPTNTIIDETAPHLTAYTIYTSGTTGRPKGVLILIVVLSVC